MQNHARKLICQVRKRNGIQVFPETKYVIAGIENDADETPWMELRGKPLQVLEVAIPHRGTALYLNARNGPVIALNDEVYLALVAVPIVRDFIIA